ncbi:hypothetical protein AB670_03302 [Chryseobacterium sp. MOF25P]|uniref:hypothetical protein n=1 Tax=unclassified Chryseobacterium TaxID=2593645 RepID=UPI000805088D|nr:MULTISPECIES: hypothetical protein [unclassified Chryseobacterium]OBW40350.1 hypothetical protein AB670_03302 [Chryseobacterium sp. MOF25P]OBW43740.1 hypothetical protein AB671_04163 [Chryseobacterium sp. BGARF1]
MKEIVYILFLLSSFLSFGQESKKDKKAIRGFVFDKPYFISTPLSVVETDITITELKEKRRLMQRKIRN